MKDTELEAQIREHNLKLETEINLEEVRRHEWEREKDGEEGLRDESS